MSFIEGIIYIMWRGIAIGVIISAPMGPVGILCVQRTLEKGRRTGLFTGIGAAISDLFYCLLTGFGLSLIEDFLKANQDTIQIVGSIVMAVFGFFLFKSNPSRKLKKPEAAQSSAKRDIIKGFLFTFSNPLIIFLIIGLFARFNFLLPEISFVQYITGYLFIILGALGWWWMVTYFVDKVRTHFNLRSMWLINKITGSIILLFALVGIVTAISNLASASVQSHRYLNTVRGMGEWDNSRDSNFMALPQGDFCFSMRVASEEYAATPWRLRLKGGDRTLTFSFRTLRDPYNELYPGRLDVSAFLGDSLVSTRSLTLEGEAGEPLAVRLSMSGGEAVLMGANRSYRVLAEIANPGWSPDSIGVIRESGSGMTADYIALESYAGKSELFPDSGYDFGDEEVRRSYFSRSSDPVEGYWEIFDREFEETRLRPGGTYRLAIAACGNGYGVYYISGAVKNAARWSSGDVKGRLEATAHPGVFDVRWLDPAGCLIDGEIKAQFADPDILTFNFVDHESTLRLRKVRGAAHMFRRLPQ